MKYFNQIIVALLSTMPMLAMAHPGHDHSTGFSAGFIHPFTGLDHLIMVIAFAVLMWSVNKRWKIWGLIGLVSAMIIGFMLGSLGWISVQVAEYGIVASLFCLTIALWGESNHIFPIFVVLLASFHGIAHGAELGQTGQIGLLVLGMVSAMALIYIVGLILAMLIEKYIPYGKQIIAGCAAVVALIGLA